MTQLWGMAQPLAHGTAPWHGLGADNWHEAAHKEGAAGSLGSDRLGTPTPAIPFLVADVCRTLPRELWQWGGTDTLGGTFPSGSIVAVPG